MYGKEFKERIGIQQLCDFLRTGAETCTVDSGTLDERADKYFDMLLKELERYRKRVLETDWESFPSQERLEMKVEELFNDILSAVWGIEAVGFEAGFTAGIQLGWTMGEQ